MKVTLMENRTPRWAGAGRLYDLDTVGWVCERKCTDCEVFTLTNTDWACQPSPDQDPLLRSLAGVALRLDSGGYSAQGGGRQARGSCRLCARPLTQSPRSVVRVTRKTAQNSVYLILEMLYRPIHILLSFLLVIVLFLFWLLHF